MTLESTEITPGGCIFTDPLAAVEEAEFLAEQSGKSHAIVAIDGDCFRVVDKDFALARGLHIVEICNP